MCKNELSMSRLSKVILLQTYRHDQDYIPRRLAGSQKYRVQKTVGTHSSQTGNQEWKTEMIRPS